MGEVIRLRRNRFSGMPTGMRHKLEYLYMRAYEFFYSIDPPTLSDVDLPIFIYEEERSAAARENALDYCQKLYKENRIETSYRIQKAREKRSAR